MNSRQSNSDRRRQAAAIKIAEYWNTKGATLLEKTAREIRDAGQLYSLDQDGLIHVTPGYSDYALDTTNGLSLNISFTGRVMSNEFDLIPHILANTLKNDLKEYLMSSRNLDSRTETSASIDQLIRENFLIMNKHLGFSCQTKVYETMLSNGLTADARMLKESHLDPNIAFICRSARGKNLLNSYNQIKVARPTLLQMANSTPVAVELYEVSVVDFHQEFPPIHHPADVARAVKSWLHLSAREWRALVGKNTLVYDNLNLKESRQIKNWQNMMLSIKLHAWAEQPIPERILSRIFQEFAYGRDTEWEWDFETNDYTDEKRQWVPLIKEFVKEGLLPREQRQDQLNLSDLSFRMSTIMDCFSRQNERVPEMTWRQYVRHSQAWHDELVIREEEGSREEDRAHSWDCLLNEYQESIYKVIPLTSGGALIDEGVEMHHCVGHIDYIRDCLSGGSVIFSIRKVEDDAERPAGTLQLVQDMHGKWYIHQLLGKYNEPVTDEIKSVGDRLVEKYNEVFLEDANASGEST